MSRKDKLARIRPGSGELRPNYYRTNERCPDYTGTIRDRRGVLYQLGGWVHKPYTGKPMISLTANDMDDAWQIPYDPMWEDNQHNQAKPK